ncbi:MAG: sensor histidine kinase, partial [Paenibacillaceae bacterium]|nr:sensor histidine kinase [Paenibacillaceae bacterium]
MRHLIRRAKTYYNNMMLQTKFTITHLLITTIPMLVMFLFFYGKLYNMVLAYTVRSEQTASAMTIPQIDLLIDTILTAQKDLEGHPYYRKLFLSRDYQSADPLTDSADAIDFCRLAEKTIDGEYITDIRIYMDLPDSQPIFYKKDTRRIFRPMSEARGAYWHGIFQGNRSYSSLFCPEFYLSPIEVRESGDMAFITKASIPYNEELRTCYIAIYYSKTPFTSLLKN